MVKILVYNKLGCCCKKAGWVSRNGWKAKLRAERPLSSKPPPRCPSSSPEQTKPGIPISPKSYQKDLKDLQYNDTPAPPKPFRFKTVATATLGLSQVSRNGFYNKTQYHLPSDNFWGKNTEQCCEPLNIEIVVQLVQHRPDRVPGCLRFVQHQLVILRFDRSRVIWC